MSLDAPPRKPSLDVVRGLGEPVPLSPPAPRPPARFRVRLASELTLRTTGSWTIKHVLPGDGFGLLYGPSTSGKSFVALDLAAHIVTGKPWNGHKVERGAVIYVALEGAVDAESRVIALREAHGLDDAAPLLFVADPLNLADAGDAKRLPDAQELARAIAEKADDLREPVRLVIVDTLARASGGMNENAADEMGVIVEAAEMIARGLACLVILVHHAPWDASRPRGSTALYAAADVVLGVKRDGEGAETTRKLTLEKLKAGRDGETWGFGLEVVDLGTDDDGDAITSCVAAWSDAPVTATGPRLSDGEALAMRAYNRAADAAGMPGAGHAGEPVVMVPRGDLVSQVASDGASTSPDPKNQRDHASRIVRGLVRRGLLCERAGMVWAPRQTRDDATDGGSGDHGAL